MTLVRLEQQRLLAASMQVESTSQHALPHIVLGGLQQIWPRHMCGEGQQSPSLPQTSCGAQHTDPLMQCGAFGGQH